MAHPLLSNDRKITCGVCLKMRRRVNRRN